MSLNIYDSQHRSSLATHCPSSSPFPATVSYHTSLHIHLTAGLPLQPPWLNPLKHMLGQPTVCHSLNISKRFLYHPMYNFKPILSYCDLEDCIALIILLLITNPLPLYVIFYTYFPVIWWRWIPFNEVFHICIYKHFKNNDINTVHFFANVYTSKCTTSTTSHWDTVVLPSCSVLQFWA
jgi:hypothetical protein